MSGNIIQPNEDLIITKASPGTISNLNQKRLCSHRKVASTQAGGRISLCLCGWRVSQTLLGGEIENVWVLVAIGINKDGYREILGAAEGMKAESLSCSRKQGRNQRKSRILTERVNREIKRRTRAIGAFPDGNSALMLVCARLRYSAASEWGTKRYLHMEHLCQMELEQGLLEDELGFY